MTRHIADPVPVYVHLRGLLLEQIAGRIAEMGIDAAAAHAGYARPAYLERHLEEMNERHAYAEQEASAFVEAVMVAESFGITLKVEVAPIEALAAYHRPRSAHLASAEVDADPLAVYEATLPRLSVWELERECDAREGEFRTLARRALADRRAS